MPVIMVAHAYGGLSNFEIEIAKKLAKLGYIGFAIDLYGKGNRAKTSDEAEKLMYELNSNRSVILSRMRTSLHTARSITFGDKDKIGVIGFCFGGKCVLDLVRSGDKINGAVVFHGLYDVPNENHNTQIVTPLLLFHGWDDPFAKPNDLMLLAKELSNKMADWEINAYGNVSHAFTNPNAKFPEKGLSYNQEATLKSWNRMVSFFSDKL